MMTPGGPPGLAKCRCPRSNVDWPHGVERIGVLRGRDEPASFGTQGRRTVALRLLESLEIAAQESVDASWTTVISSRVDDVLSGQVETIPGEEAFAQLAERRASRLATRNA